MALSKTILYKELYKNKIVDMLKDPTLLKFYFGRLVKYNKMQAVDALIISYPKSGRTWLQNILKEIGLLEFNDDQTVDASDGISKSLELLGNNSSGFPKFLANHASSSWEQAEGILGSEEIKKDDLNLYNKSKILFLYRDPRDVMVSQYYHLKNRNKIKSVEKEDMISNDIVGLKKIINFMNKWNEFEKANTEILGLSYEEMKADTGAAVSKLFNFIGVPLEKGIIDQAVENSTLKKMQKKQASNSNKDPWTKTSNPKNINSFQSRKGVVGDYLNFFSEDQILRINKIISEHLSDDFGYS